MLIAEDARDLRAPDDVYSLLDLSGERESIQ